MIAARVSCVCSSMQELTRVRQEHSQLSSQLSSLKMDQSREIEAKQRQVMAGAQELDTQLKQALADKAELQRSLMAKLAEAEQKLAHQSQVRVLTILVLPYTVLSHTVPQYILFCLLILVILSHKYPDS